MKRPNRKDDNEVTDVSYQEVLRMWFYPRASVPSYYGMGIPDDEETTTLKGHLDRCGIRWVKEPTFATRPFFAGTFTEDLMIGGIAALVSCQCDESEGPWGGELFIKGELTLSQVIIQVLETANSMDANTSGDDE